MTSGSSTYSWIAPTTGPAELRRGAEFWLSAWRRLGLVWALSLPSGTPVTGLREGLLELKNRASLFPPISKDSTVTANRLACSSSSLTFLDLFILAPEKGRETQEPTSYSSQALITAATSSSRRTQLHFGSAAATQAPPNRDRQECKAWRAARYHPRTRLVDCTGCSQSRRKLRPQ